AGGTDSGPGKARAAARRLPPGAGTDEPPRPPPHPARDQAGPAATDEAHRLLRGPRHPGVMPSGVGRLSTPAPRPSLCASRRVGWEGDEQAITDVGEPRG